MVPPNNNNTQNHENQQDSSSESKKSDQQQQQRVVVKCPRCDSPNTKFCYYNNYSLTQPRHFCKTCRRYWTNGGSLRNVPIGGGCRKKQKLKNSSLSSPSSLSSISKFSSSPSLDFHLGGLLPLPLPLPFSSKPYFYNQFSSIAGVSNSNTSPSSFHLDPSSTSNPMMGLNLYPFSSTSNGNGFINENSIQGMNFMNVSSSTSTSTTAAASTSTSLAIESLSCMNQDLHLKLQQQRLATMFGGDNEKKDSLSGNDLVSQVSSIEKPQPILFQNLENSKPEMFQGVADDGDMRKAGPNPSEWFFEMNSYSSVMTPTRNNDSVCMNGDHDNGNINNNHWISSDGVHAWGDVQQQQLPYSVLP